MPTGLIFYIGLEILIFGFYVTFAVGFIN